MRSSEEQSKESTEDEERPSEERSDDKEEKKSLLPSGEEGDEKTDTGKGLARTLTLTNCVTMIVGCIIGSGIFVSPTGVQQGAGSVGSSIIIWILGGLWCALGAYIYAELGTLITKSGGDYAYIMEAFGPFLAFLRLWIESIVVRPTALAIMALTFALYLLRLIYVDCDPPAGTTELLATALITVLCALNCWSVKLVTKVQDVLTYAKLVALALVIGTSAYLFIFGGPQYHDTFDHIFEGNFRSFSAPAVAFYSSLFSYQGWTFLNFITEELINPKRNLPLSVFISMGIVTAIYVLYNLALYVVLSPEEMLLSPAAGVLYAEKVYGKFAFIMPVAVALSTVGSSNGIIMTSSRLFFCGAREGHFPGILAMINKRLRTPIPAVIFNCFVAIVYVTMSGRIYVLITASQSTVWMAIVVVTFVLFRLRCTMPDAERAVKVPLVFPIVFVIGSVIFIAFSIFGSPFDTALGILLVLTAVPLYVLFIAIGLPEPLSKLLEDFTMFWQKVFMIVDDND